MVIVDELLEAPFRHFIPKVPRSIERSDPRCVLVHYPEVACRPGNRFPQFDQTSRPPSDSSLSRVSHRLCVKVQIPREIETPLGGFGPSSEGASSRMPNANVNPLARPLRKEGT